MVMRRYYGFETVLKLLILEIRLEMKGITRSASQTVSTRLFLLRQGYFSKITLFCLNLTKNSRSLGIRISNRFSKFLSSVFSIAELVQKVAKCYET